MDMEGFIVKIRNIGQVTHDTLQIVMDKPFGYHFNPGQATEVAINKKGWEQERRPFTFTNLPGDDHLELIIKTYPSHQGVTQEMRNLQPGDELIIQEVWGAIAYKGEGVFIAGGAGITPFLSIFRHLKSQNKMNGNRLIFANKMRADIIRGDELSSLLGDSFINILSHESAPGYFEGQISKEFLKEQIPEKAGKIYVCGPPPMMEAVTGCLVALGIEENALVVEI